MNSMRVSTRIGSSQESVLTHFAMDHCFIVFSRFDSTLSKSGSSMRFESWTQPQGDTLSILLGFSRRSVSMHIRDLLAGSINVGSSHHLALLLCTVWPSLSSF